MQARWTHFCVPVRDVNRRRTSAPHSSTSVEALMTLMPMSYGYIPRISYSNRGWSYDEKLTTSLTNSSTDVMKILFPECEDRLNGHLRGEYVRHDEKNCRHWLEVKICFY